jgi:hypothetical protein
MIYYMNVSSFARVHIPEAVDFLCPIHIYCGDNKIGMGI